MTTTFTASPREISETCFCRYLLLDGVDQHRRCSHEQAVAFTHTLRTAKTITTEDVLDEYLAYFAGARSSVRIQAGNTVADILDNEGILVIPHSHETFLAGLELYRARPDKGYSLTDCISMQIMRREGLSEVLTNDRHFEQEGFRALLRF